MPDTSTVFQAEIEAISHACQYALANLKELNIKYIKILSDSQAAIKALNKPRLTSQSVLTTLEYMETLAIEVKHLTLAWIKAHVGTEGNEQADQAAKEGAAGVSHMKDTQTPIPWQVVKNKIEFYTTAKWKHKWITAPHYKHTKHFYDSPNKNKSKYILEMGTHMLSTWIKSITVMTDCEATSSLQLDIMKNQIPLPDMTWSVKDKNTFIQHPLIHSLMTYDTQNNNREIEYIEHNYSSDASSL